MTPLIKVLTFNIMNRVEEINKQIAKLNDQIAGLRIEREKLIDEGISGAEPVIEKHYQEALKLKGKYIRWVDAEGIVRLAKVSDIHRGSEVELVLEKFFVFWLDNTFCTDNSEHVTYAVYSPCAGAVLFKGDRFSVIDETEYLKAVHDAVDKFCL